jgi:hypothetical protein
LAPGWPGSAGSRVIELTGGPMANPDPQDQAEALDDDRIDGDYPPDRPLGVDAYGTTGAEERWDEPLAERVSREEPDDDERARTDFATDPEVGALDDGDVLTGDTTTRDVVLEREAPAAAEEAAIHVDDDVA